MAASPSAVAACRTNGWLAFVTNIKVTGDLKHWIGRIVLGGDEAAERHFFGGLGLHENMSLVGQSNSNLWFTSWEKLPENGGPVGWGGWWRDDDVKQDQWSVPFLFAGYQQRVLHLFHGSAQPVTFRLEVSDGRGEWRKLTDVVVPPK